MIPPAGIEPGKNDLFYNESHDAWRQVAAVVDLAPHSTL